MTKTPTANYLSIAAPGNSFNARISADSDIFARNDIDALGDALDLHDHSTGKGLIVQTLNGSQINGDLFYATAANTLARLGVGGTNAFLQVIGGVPAWNLSAFTSWTPTLTQGVGLTITVTTATYLQIGKMVLAVARVGITSAGTATNGFVLGGLPVAPKFTANPLPLGLFVYGIGVTSNRVGTAYAVSSTTAQFITDAATNVFGTNPAVTAANTDSMAVCLAYEAA